MTVAKHPHFFFFFNDTATTEIYTLSLHDALPISTIKVRRPNSIHEPPHRIVGAVIQRPPPPHPTAPDRGSGRDGGSGVAAPPRDRGEGRSEEHTSELQSRPHLVCRLLLEKKKNKE